MKTLFEKFTSDSENVWKLFTFMKDGLIITDYHQRIVAINPAFEKITGYKYKEVYMQNPKVLQSGKTEPKTFHSMWESLSNEGTWTGEIINKRKTGEEFWSYITITYIKKKRKEDCYYIGIMRDITEQKQNEKKISHLAYHDTLTQLPNRALFVKKLRQSLKEASESNKKLALLFLDLDRFKNVNDSLGHQAGDQLLLEVSRRLQQVIGDRGIVSRFGGDEFTILLHPIESEDEVHKCINNIFHSLDLPIEVVGESIYITLSIGASFYPEHGSDIHTLLKNADSAMYRTKDEGRNNFQFYDHDMNEGSLEKFYLEHELHRAIENNEFEVHYQLQVDVQTGMPYGVEGLIRWNHPKKGLISPAQFLPLAEDTGLIVQMDHWVMKTAFAQTKKWHEKGHSDLMISVNISKQQFESYHFIDKVKQTILETRIDPHLVCLEITENMAINNVEQAVNKLTELKEMGIHVSLDDFGTGYSSLSQLKNFPIDTLKIDQSFVRTQSGGGKNDAIVKLIIAMAKSLNFTVTCEGVETEEQLILIRNEGCHHAQGFLFSKPLTHEKCEAMMGQMKEVIEEE
ncbi:EAL domain-containing protein [Bacillus sp. FJAT-45350]|uniref:EAL domain-containing protein n=1 Tax=Bacillus sp. FJAT-45350 TaxID=2011014 RepID=UPI0015C72915|nr:EAL domain-containing protein [Bacillus sp. FJAT-45350]